MTLILPNLEIIANMGVAELTSVLLDGFEPERDEAGKTLGHAVWMMANLPDDPIKAARWVGYVHAILVFKDIVTLEELRDLVRPIR